MHLEHLGDSKVWGGRGRWMVSMDGTRVSLGFTRLPRANGTDDLMPRLVVSKLCYGDPLMLECYFYALLWMCIWKLNNFCKLNNSKKWKLMSYV